MAKVNGQSKLAEQAIFALTQRDPLFLQSLVHPYLNGIILHGVERSRKTSGIKEPVAPKEFPKKAVPSPAAKKPVSGNMLDNLMKELAKGFDAELQQGSKKVSQNHINAMQSLIKKK